MAADVRALSLSRVHAWDTEHLITASIRWTNEAQIWEDVYTTTANEIVAPGGTNWLGAAAEAAQQRTALDRVKVVGLVDDLHTAAEVARRGADRLAHARRAVLTAVDRAHNDLFVVGEDFLVSESAASPFGSAIRQAEALAHANEIRMKVIALVELDREIATAISSAAGHLENVQFDAPVQMLDNEEEEGHSEAPRVRGLPPDGVRPPVEGDLTPGPASRPSEVRKGGQSLWDENGGEWRYFPGDKYHNPHWDYNPHDAPNSGWENRPIGDLPPVKDDPGPAHAPPVSIPSPPVSSDDITVGGILAGTAAAGAWILSQLGKLAHPLS